jgi:hypothetical protein
VRRHEVDRLRVARSTGDEEIPFVLAVLVVDQNHHATAAHVGKARSTHAPLVLLATGHRSRVTGHARFPASSRQDWRGRGPHELPPGFSTLNSPVKADVVAIECCFCMPRHHAHVLGLDDDRHPEGFNVSSMQLRIST